MKNCYISAKKSCSVSGLLLVPNTNRIRKIGHVLYFPYVHWRTLEKLVRIKFHFILPINIITISTLNIKNQSHFHSIWVYSFFTWSREIFTLFEDKKTQFFKGKKRKKFFFKLFWIFNPKHSVCFALHWNFIWMHSDIMQSRLFLLSINHTVIQANKDIALHFTYKFCLQAEQQ